MGPSRKDIKAGTRCVLEAGFPPLHYLLFSPPAKNMSTMTRALPVNLE